MEIKVVRDILEANEVIASQNRTLFTEKGIYVVNLMGSLEQERQHCLREPSTISKTQRGLQPMPSPGSDKHRCCLPP